AIPISQPNTQCVNPSVDPPPVIAFLLRGEKPRTAVPTTTAEPEAFWESSLANETVASLLPITVGEVGDCGRPLGRTREVRTLGQAHEIFRHAGRGPHHNNRADLVEELGAEVLAAKLNIARGHVHGEQIDRGWIY